MLPMCYIFKMSVCSGNSIVPAAQVNMVLVYFLFFEFSSILDCFPFPGVSRSRCAADSHDTPKSINILHYYLYHFTWQLVASVSFCINHQWPTEVVSIVWWLHQDVKCPSAALIWNLSTVIIWLCKALGAAVAERRYKESNLVTIMLSLSSGCVDCGCGRWMWRAPATE